MKIHLKVLGFAPLHIFTLATMCLSPRIPRPLFQHVSLVMSKSWWQAQNYGCNILLSNFLSFHCTTCDTRSSYVIFLNFILTSILVYNFCYSISLIFTILCFNLHYCFLQFTCLILKKFQHNGILRLNSFNY
jgi:hypothetical protein